MFYPQLTRRNIYRLTRNGDYYADYREYLAEITEDCKERCIYCDALLSEHGGEGFHLDHFRPAVHFPGLATNPNNLVLACAKCNIFKSKNWHNTSYFHACASHDGISGFYDPFHDQLSNYFLVDSSGKLISQDKVSAYMLELLHLNRESRLQLRRRRILVEKIRALNSLIDDKLENLKEYLCSGDFNKAIALDMLDSIKAAKSKLTNAFNAIHPKN